MQAQAVALDVSMARAKVTGAERREFRRDMRDFRRISAAYDSLLEVKEKRVKSQSEHQAALGQAKMQYELAIDKYFLKYDGSPVLESVRRLEDKVRINTVLSASALIALGFAIMAKQHPAAQEHIQVLMDYFKNNAIGRVGSALLIAIGVVTMGLAIPLEQFFSGTPVNTFDFSISYAVESKEWDKK